MSSAFDDYAPQEEAKDPFLLPFLSALIFGIPLQLLWFYLIMNFGVGWLYILVGVGALCGLGSKLAGGSAFAAIMAALVHITFTLAIMTVMTFSYEMELPFYDTVLWLLGNTSFKTFADECLEVASNVFIYTPFVLLGAYRIGKQAD